MSDATPVPTADQRLTLSRLARGWKLYRNGATLHLRRHLDGRSGGTVTHAAEHALRRAGWVRWGAITERGRSELEARTP